MNILLTGNPGIGKTTVLIQIKNHLQENGYRIGGVCCPEIREIRQRVGFKIVDLMTKTEGILSHIKCKGPRLGKYRVNLSDLDDIGTSAIYQALDQTDFVLIDEIGPMELHSPKFRRAVLEAFESPKTVIAVIHKKSRDQFILKLKNRGDVKIFDINNRNRDSIHKDIIKQLI
ncbi:MAG: NTPase [Methanobacteriaceae archaeon]|nr:NTPase [Methanobacteriaceae archaeon]